MSTEDGVAAVKTNLTRKFLLVLIILGIVTFIASVIAKNTILKKELTGNVHIALVVDLSGSDQNRGQAMKAGAQLYVDHINKTGGLLNQKLVLDIFDSQGKTAQAKALAQTITKNKKIIAVIDQTNHNKSLYQNAKLPVLTVLPHKNDNNNSIGGAFSLAFTPLQEARFMANYVRNVLIKRNASIIFDQTISAGTIEAVKKVYERFGVPIRHEWSLEGGTDGTVLAANASSVNAQIEDIIAQIKANPDSGALFVLAKPDLAAHFVKTLRLKKQRNVVAGFTSLAGNRFLSSLAPSPSEFADKVYASTPLLFDTAGEATQGFLTNFQNAYGYNPDWISANSYDAIRLVVQAYRKEITADLKGLHDLERKGVTTWLAGLKMPQSAFDSMGGALYFNDQGENQRPVKVGRYDGQNFISAPVQLQPIAGKMSNYFDALKGGRVLYVNDRFMYKTNVVYSGLKILEINDVDFVANSFTMDFMIWFRFSGKFFPEQVTFNNAIGAIDLGKPDREDTQRGVHYRRYHAKGKFSMEFLKTKHPYGTRILGTQFHHKGLDSNNLLYVVDMIGLNMQQAGGFKAMLAQANIFGPQKGYNIDRAWIAQSLDNRNSLGDPSYTGYGKTAPSFSNLSAAMIAKASGFSVRDFISEDYLSYGIILGLLGLLFAHFMDVNNAGYGLWGLYSWLLRLFSWPVLLITGGALALDFAATHMPSVYTDKFVLLLKSLWWLIGAFLISLAFERFVWNPLERQTGRKIPGSIRSFSTLIIYLFAIFGIIAFVFGQQLTSLLATSGLMAMIIGLAVQANLANVFSGIILNIERPFQVGDYLKIGTGANAQEAKVTDISWRTTKVINNLKHQISIPNAVMSESQIELIYVPMNKQPYRQFSIYEVSANHDPKTVKAALEWAFSQVEEIAKDPAPGVDHKGILTALGSPTYIAYRCSYHVSDFSQRGAARTKLGEAVWEAFQKAGIKLVDINDA